MSALAPVRGVYKPDFSPTSAALRVAAAVIPPAEISQPAVQVERSECSCELRPITCPNFFSVFITIPHFHLFLTSCLGVLPKYKMNFY